MIYMYVSKVPSNPLSEVQNIPLKIGLNNFVSNHLPQVQNISLKNGLNMLF